MSRIRFGLRLLAGVVVATLAAGPVSAQKKYDPGASDSEIKIGQTMPYSGPASSYGTIGLAMAAYFEKINAEDGVNGRKITLLSRDDGFQSSKTVEMTRMLVEQDEVLFMAASLGTAPNIAVQKYLNGKKVPQLFVATGATRWSDPANFPWTMGWQPSYQIEGAILGRYTVSAYPAAKIGILYQNDDSGKDYLKGFKAGLGDAAKQIVAEISYELSDPTVDSQIVALKTAGADTFFLHANPRFSAQAIRRAYELNWRPAMIMASVGASVGAALAPAGLEKSVGAVTAAYMKDAADKVCGKCGGEVDGFHEAVVSTRQPERRQQSLRLFARTDDRRRPQAMRGQSDARERHEAGGFSQERRTAAAAAGCPSQHQP